MDFNTTYLIGFFAFICIVFAIIVFAQGVFPIYPRAHGYSRGGYNVYNRDYENGRHYPVPYNDYVYHPNRNYDYAESTLYSNYNRRNWGDLFGMIFILCIIGTGIYLHHEYNSTKNNNEYPLYVTDSIGRGKIPVLKSSPPTSSVSIEEQDSHEKELGNYYVQTGAFAQVENAFREKQRWTDQGIPAKVIVFNNIDDYTRVLVGAFTTAEEAQAFMGNQYDDLVYELP